MSKSNHVFKTLFMFLALALIIGIALILSESLLKYQHQQSTLNSLFEKRLIWIKNLSPNANPTFSSSTINDFDSFQNIHQTYKASTDSLGFIVTNRNHNNPDFKFAFLGGSIPQSLYMVEHHRMPEAVSINVEKKTGLHINTWNCAAGGTNSFHTLNVLTNLTLEVKPDYAFFYGNINDITTLIHYGKFNNDNPKWGIFFERQSTNDNLLPTLKTPFPYLLHSFQSVIKKSTINDDFADVRNKPLIFDSAVITPHITQVFKTIIAVCKANKIQPVLVTQVNIFNRLSFAWFEKNMKLSGFTQKNYAQMLESFELYNRILTQVAIDENVILIRLPAEQFSFSDFYDPSHFNEKGTILASSMIAEQFIQLSTISNTKNN